MEQATTAILNSDLNLAQEVIAADEKIDDFQQTVNQHIDVMKKRFSTAMRDFLKATTDDATRQNDAHMWQVANTFYKKFLPACVQLRKCSQTKTLNLTLT